MSATLRRPIRGNLLRTGTRPVLVLGRGRLVNWSNKASPATWRARRRGPRGRRR